VDGSRLYWICGCLLGSDGSGCGDCIFCVYSYKVSNTLSFFFYGGMLADDDSDDDDDVEYDAPFADDWGTPVVLLIALAVFGYVYRGV
jgi:hypothetical protein